MNKTAIKNYAIWARVSLIESAKQRAYQYEITKDNITDANADVVSGKPLTKDEKEQRRQLIDQINSKGFDQVMEEVAYTWFNRFIALRFMEVNGYLPSKIRVFTDSEGNFKPEILKEALTVELPVDKSRVIELLEKQDNEELYKMLLIAQCNELSNGLPDMFEVISNYTELLFPNNLLKEDSILGEMVNSIPEKDWTDAVQIIGWLYQYYNSELKDETFALLKKNVKISKERIPAATQLFTPDWIVRYMVENSLGRLWYEGHPNTEIKKEWKYYLDEAQQKPEVEEQLKAIREECKTIKPEDIKVIDPCMGSGHILVYAFDVLMQIYTSAGWSERDAAESILENNLYGLDIDDRAGQLAYFAVLMKARKYSRRILAKNIRPKVYSIQESNDVKIEAWWRLGPEENIARRLVQDFTDAKEYGSILILSVTAEELQALRKRLDDIEEMSDQGNLLDVIQSDEITRQLYPLIEVANLLGLKYDVVITNPPYMGYGNMNKTMASYLIENYKEVKSDLFSVFIDRCISFTKPHRYSSLITQQAFMFLSSYSKLRSRIIEDNFVSSMCHLGFGTFGADFGTTAFVINNTSLDYNACYMDVGDAKSSEEKKLLFLKKNTEKSLYTSPLSRFLLLPNLIFAYWISQPVLDSYTYGERLGSYGMPHAGMCTCDNDRFLRLWHEINWNAVNLSSSTAEEAVKSKAKWFPYCKGGDFRRWYGNRNYVVNWLNDGEEMKAFICERYKTTSYSKEIRSEKDYFKSYISYSALTIGKFSARFIPQGSLFDSGGSCIVASEHYEGQLAILNSIIGQMFLDITNTTINYQPGDIGGIPIYKEIMEDNSIKAFAKDAINLSKIDWDSYETSWDFRLNPLI